MDRQDSMINIKIVSEYDQEIQQSQTADNPMAQNYEKRSTKETPPLNVSKKELLNLAHI